ncbi:uncharacterized protein LOC131038833 [Cryptomeria japonica]|uniref:uncharacterized protein LOC131038833 n=1 Tax=Cryptomeria japonica TaxID=3369 RepID=UPI0027DA834F|nr:uncharacterized protein LOC131038833 [Cryptomeria japonica]
MDWANVLGENVAMFLSDFDKAYDRVEWEFILMMLEDCGFPVEFYKWVKVLLKDGSKQVEINGSLTQVYVRMIIEKNKFLRFLKERQAKMFVHELENGYKWRQAAKEHKSIDLALESLGIEIGKTKDPVMEHIQMLSQLLEGKQELWMEGPLGWTTWMEAFQDHE